MNELEKRITFKAIWNHEYVMIEIARIIPNDMRVKDLKQLANRITTLIQNNKIEEAESILFSWAYKYFSKEYCKEEIEYIRRALKEGE